MDSAVFVPWLHDWLLPQLAPGTTIVCDTLSVHKPAAVRPAVGAAGCRLEYLPAYSPDVNPIELRFATLNAHRRAVARRTFDTLFDLLVAAIGTGLDAITATDIVGCDRHCGFVLPAPEAQPS